ncbi:MAG: DegT/DnrJ/EryC1/StrS family aminotransferase [Armatimonadetes bacterium]|nr:DegT/DnrJ/EryC1/StrS family aminotransferase [Armatimonadota bacterium]
MSTLAMNGGTPVRSKPWPGWPMHDETEKTALLEVLESGRWGRLSGDRVAAFEQAFAGFQNARYGIAVTNGTAALEIALKAAGIDIGDEVIVPAYTFVATATAVLQNNAVPVFVDVEPDTINIDPKAVEAAITPRTRAVMPVHWLGRACDMDGLTALARKHNLVIIEDACHCWGSQWNGKGLGAVGAAGGFSFQESKNITGGEGGMILTDDEALAARAFSLHHIGRLAGRPFYEHALPGGNYRMTEFQAAVLLCQLARLEEQTLTRERNAAFLNAHLGAIPGLTPLRREPYMTRISWHAYSLIYDAERMGGVVRERWMEAMAAEGVPFWSGYPHPLYRNPLFRDRAFGRILDYIDFPDYREVECPVSEALCRSDYVLMGHPTLLGTEEDMRDIVRAAEKVAQHAGELR